jgi:hypothetical protein
VNQPDVSFRAWPTAAECLTSCSGGEKHLVEPQADKSAK